MKLKIWLSFLLLLVLLIGAGCDTENAPEQVSEGYPVETAVSDQQPVEETPFIVPTPGADTGVVTGQLLTPGPGGDPYIATLYLGGMVYADQPADNPPLISFSEEESPKGVQDPESGRFAFAAVPPGDYALIVWTPVFSSVVRDPETDLEIMFTVEPGQVIDLGVIGIP